MISIIVSTYKPENILSFSENIQSHIGVEYEIIAINNKGKYGLCEAYNIGIKQAKYKYICFCHDDIQINRENWGQYVIDEFNSSEDLGLLGVAGSIYKTYSPSGWFFPDDYPLQRTDLWHSKKDIISKTKTHLYNKSLLEESTVENVVVLDGCWLFTTKEVTDKYKFDEKLLKGYHCYDLDYSLQVGKEYKLGVIYNLDLIHLSEGNFDRSWVTETFKLHNKWKSLLPISITRKDLSPSEVQTNEFKAFLFIMGKVFEYDVPVKYLLLSLYSTKLFSLMGMKNWVKVNLWTWSSILKKLEKRLR